MRGIPVLVKLYHGVRGNAGIMSLEREESKGVFWQVKQKGAWAACTMQSKEHLHHILIIANVESV